MNPTQAPIQATGTLAALQFRPTRGDWEASATALTALCLQAAAGGARIIVCPEMALTGYLFPSPAAARAVAEPRQGRTLARFGAFARAHGCVLVIGYPEHDGDALYNAALVIGPDGELIYNYRKRLLYEADRSWAAPGDQPYLLLETELGTLTVGICMDMNDDRFTGFLRREAPRRSPFIVAFCTNWLDQGFDIRPYWAQRLGGAPCLLVAANTYGVEDIPGCPRTRFLGRSAIIDYRAQRRGETRALAAESGDAVLLTSAHP